MKEVVVLMFVALAVLVLLIVLPLPESWPKWYFAILCFAACVVMIWKVHRGWREENEE